VELKLNDLIAAGTAIKWNNAATGTLYTQDLSLATGHTTESNN
jgi:hypothetical protein